MTSALPPPPKPKPIVEPAQKHMAEIFGQALDLALEKKDPQQKHERRQARERRREAATAAPSPDEVASSEPVTSRHIASEVRGRVLDRAGYQCEYRARDGTRCTSRTGLQIEHARPFAIYHSHDEQYLRAYCPAHNRLAAERVYGARRKIDARSRREREPYCT